MKRYVATLVLLGFAILFSAPFLGATGLSPLRLLAGEGSAEESIIFWQLRVPRVLLAFLVGSALSISGVVFQALFRNPLACPFTLGVSGGASVGVALATYLGVSLGMWGISGTVVAAFVGAVAVIFLVSISASGSGGFSSGSLLLSGVMISFFCSSLILFLQYLSDVAELARVSRWLMGNLEIVGVADAITLLVVVVLAVTILLLKATYLDLLSLGDELAVSRGLNVAGARTFLFLITSAVVAVVVSAAGPIGFIGILVPHFCRAVVGSQHATLLLASAFGGGVFLVLCDVAARVVIAPLELPVGVVTALIGAPSFLIVLWRTQRP